jgi:FkbM family methyltransferase
MSFELDADGFNALRMCRWGPMLYNRNDMYIGASLERYGEAGWAEQQLFGQIVQPGTVALDIGANIGVHTIVLSRLAGPGGVVLAFEPQRLVFQALCANLALNQCANVYACQEAVGNEDGTIAVPSLDPAQQNNFGGLSLAARESGEPVRLKKVDSLQLPACHFLKVDVEGMEKEVLEGAEATIARHRPVMFVENEQEQKSAPLIEYLLEREYELYWHASQAFNPQNFAGESENIFAGLMSLNMLCVPREAGIPVSRMRRVSSPADRWTA